jgi:hypothetical protein
LFRFPEIQFAVRDSVIACDKREAFAQGSAATKQSMLPRRKYGLLRFARNDVERCSLLHQHVHMLHRVGKIFLEFLHHGAG